MEDAPMAQFWFNLPEIRSRLGMQYPLARLNEENFLRGMIESKTDMIFVIVLSDGNKPMGSVGIHGINPVHRFAELGIAIGEKEHRNEGYGTEATRLVLGYCFETLDLERVELVVMEDNLRAKKV
ncbi:MAG: GNAT family N-acetyltransferase, partial [Thermoplasmata archaeon]|nr:GNAT family N-acetyltransferase [Thermoplasmata archaeon]